ncbi:leucine-rich repeat-containing protein 49-like isoform X2 [Pecten maximus]|uniref:leucine-rich repeat-containing protein 49-like isoform X2 n=1 Tax=Pecten maximus TaxID=6579 RepID=UPI001457FD84|nr:leucine-rich repeat-containing protein 49-like isoform X2 [Pecten maximus]
MFNKPRSRLNLPSKETNDSSSYSTLESLQILPTISSKTYHTAGRALGSTRNPLDRSSVYPQDQEQIVFRPTQINSNDNVNMKRYSQGPPDFTLNHIAEKVPIHYRSNKKQIVPAPALAHDLSTPELQDLEESGRSSRSSAHLSPKTLKAPAFLPGMNLYGYGDNRQTGGDRVIFAESPSAPGIPVVYRTPDERSSNPDRLNLDRRKLTVCPILEGEEQLRLLNYQHNMIGKIQHLSTLKRLIFLDLYDNQIEEISGLSALKSLRVLMLGKNKIKAIENLETLCKLDVLDLHGNQIGMIENLNHLSELRVLNLAGNQIAYVDNLSGLDSLAELNLRRNRIRTVVDVDNLPSLQRLFLSFNDISSFEDIACLGDSNSLSEITLDGNPITQEQYYKQIVLRHMQQLKQLDMKRVTEEERRIALVMARKEEEKKREGSKAAVLKEKKRIAINNAKRQWEVMQGTMINRTGKLVKMPDIYANHVGSVPNSDLVQPMTFSEENLDLESVHSEKYSSRGGSRPSSAQSSNVNDGTEGNKDRPRTSTNSANSVKKVEPQKCGQLKETIIFGQGDTTQGGGLNNLADLEGDTLTLYGAKSLEGLDRNWGMQAAAAITHIFFKFIDFDEIVKHLHKVRTRFPGVQTVTFSATNIRTLSQINALSNIRRLDNLTIDLDGNPVTKFTLWRMYVIFRLAHFALKKINDIEVSASDIVNAEKLYGPVSHITTSQLPQSRLLSLLGETRRKQLLAMSEEKSKKFLEGKLDKSQGEFVGRSGLHYTSPDTVSSKSTEQQAKKTFARSYINEIVKETVFADRKKNELLKLWPSIFHEMIYSAVADMADIQGYSKRCLEEIEKGS